ncbi:MAG: hypothetical protein HY360_14930 [Verrucomicrobia bacterium]|nr:hypothetical protein [Verrucomicrobiota bacterium]
MVFYVYFDPAMIGSAEKDGNYALQCLIGILRGFEANCLLAEFDDYFVQETLQGGVNDLHDDNVRKALKSLLGTLQKRNRFVYSLVSGCESPDVRVAVALGQGKEAELDLVVSENAAAHRNPHGIPTSTLLAYNTTGFEADRCAAATGGRTFAADARESQDFMNWTLRKALKYCSVIQVYDEHFGKNFGGNFEYSTKVLITWLETLVAYPDQVQLHIHCGKPSGNTDHFIRTRLASFRRGRLARMPITIQFYQTAFGVEPLLHERYLVTNQMAINLGRGLDFLNPTTGRNRDGKFSFAGFDELGVVLKTIPASSLPPMIV